MYHRIIFISNHNLGYKILKHEPVPILSPYNKSQNTSYIKEEISSTNSLHFNEEMIPAENSSKVVDQSTYNSTQYFDSPIKFQDRGKAEALSRTEIMEDCVDFANCRTLYYDTRYGSLLKRSSTRVCPKFISSVTQSSNIEDIKLKTPSRDINHFKIQIKTVSSEIEKKKMKKSRRLMKVLQNRLNTEMMTCTCIPNIIKSNKVIEDLDKRFKVLKPRFDKNFITPNTTSLFTLSRVLSRKNSPVIQSKIDKIASMV